MTAISKNVCFNVLKNIAGAYNNTYHKTIKMRPIGVKNDFFLNIMKNLIKKTLDSK